MSAGLYLTGKIWRFSYPSDDRVGGAVPTGTAVYSNVRARIEAEQPTLALMEQGLETPTIFTAVLQPGNLVLEHNDQFEVTAPAMSPHYGKKFRIISIQNSSMIDPRAFLIVSMRRFEEARIDALQ